MDYIDKVRQAARERWNRIDRALASPYGSNEELYRTTVQMVQAAHFPTEGEFARRAGTHLLQVARDHGAPEPHYDLFLEMVLVMRDLYTAENLNTPTDIRGLGMSQGVGELRDELLALCNKAQNPEQTLLDIEDCIAASFLLVTQHLPSLAHGASDGDFTAEGAAITVRVIDITPNVADLIDRAIYKIFYHPTLVEMGLFKWLRAQLDANKRAAGAGTRSVEPSQFKGSPREIVSTFLNGTFLDRLFNVRLPFDITIEDRLEHCSIVAGSGWGKTQLLQTIIAEDLQSEDPPSLVVIDSTGAVVQRIQRLAVFNDKLKDRLIIIDPELSPAPALNMFDISNERLQHYTDMEREGVESEIVSLFNYVFSSIENALTGQQATAFAFMVRLLLTMPGANLNTMRDLLEDKPRRGYEDADPLFKQYIDRLDETAQAFFQRQYYTTGFDARRDQIAQRIYAVTKVPAFERMFSSVNKLDLYDELQNKGSIIVVNTSENLLKEASVTFGRYIIARCMAAAFERASLPV